MKSVGRVATVVCAGFILTNCGGASGSGTASNGLSIEPRVIDVTAIDARGNISEFRAKYGKHNGQHLQDTVQRCLVSSSDYEVFGHAATHPDRKATGFSVAIAGASSDGSLDQNEVIYGYLADARANSLVSTEQGDPDNPLVPALQNFARSIDSDLKRGRELSYFNSCPS